MHAWLSCVFCQAFEKQPSCSEIDLNSTMEALGVYVLQSLEREPLTARLGPSLSDTEQQMETARIALSRAQDGLEASRAFEQSKKKFRASASSGLCILEKYVGAPRSKLRRSFLNILGSF